uniref:AT-hook motif nuclear-localized protein n=1 Tax=Leersia perrieri TaxID=77586 RepID=A0A0D9VBM2_9ORYZ
MEPETETTAPSPASPAAAAQPEEPEPEAESAAPVAAMAVAAVSSQPPAPALVPAMAAAAPATAAAAGGRGEGKRKRGRPRKYGPDGSLLRPPLKATPISASVPDDSGGGHYTPAAAVGAVMKRGRGRPVGFVSRASPVAVAVTAATPTAAVVVSSPAATHTPLGPLGELVACASGANFTPHIINVAAGEDVNMKVISFSQQGPRAICILSANGVISNVTLRQQDTLGGTVTYEGRFELLSLSGSFTPTDSGGTRSRSGGMSVSLAATDGRVIGGGVAGLLVAASPVQVVVGSFLPSYQLDQNAKKPVIEITTVPPPPPTIGFTISSGDHMEDSYSGSQQRSATTTTAKANSTSAFRVENWTAPVPEVARKTPSSEAKVPVPGA